MTNTSQDYGTTLAAIPIAQVGLRLLREARDCAERLGEDPWQFAVEIEALRDAGLTNSVLRELLHSGQLEHAEELPDGRRKQRAFRQVASLALSARTCFVLKPAGAVAAPPAAGGQRPRWHVEQRRPSLAGQIVKVFHQVALAQVTVLSAFEEEGWPLHIDDPLPPRPEQDPKQRLADTIKNLNRTCLPSRRLTLQCPLDLKRRMAVHLDKSPRY